MTNKTNNLSYRIGHSLILIAAAIALIFEQSPANEALRAILGFNVLVTTNNPIYVAVAVAVVTLLIELISSSLIALGLQKSVRFHRIAKKFIRRNDTSSDRNSASDYILALGIGAGMLVIKKHLRNSQRRISDDLKSALKAAMVIALFSGLIGFLGGGGVELAYKLGFGEQAKTFLDVVTDWRFWLGLVAITQTWDYLVNRSRNN